MTRIDIQEIKRAPGIFSQYRHSAPLRYANVCVYTHSVNNEVFYVGKGTAGRPFTIGGSIARNPEWFRIVAEHGYFEAEIVSWHDDNKSALSHEQELIKKYSPAANFRNNGKNKPTKHRAAKR